MENRKEVGGSLVRGIQAANAPAGVIEQKEDLIKKVYVTHYRFLDYQNALSGKWSEDTHDLFHETEARHIIQTMKGNMGRGKIAFFPRGGTTEVTIILNDGREVTGRADCSLEDNYNKKRGKHIAYQRALKNL